LGHSSVIALLDYVLSTKKYSEYLCKDTGNWQARFTHAFAFSAATCCDELRKRGQSGWDNAVADNFETNEVEVAYYRYLEYITSLVGERRSIFDQMLFGMCQKDRTS
jgi:hypothetical protein